MSDTERVYEAWDAMGTQMPSRPYTHHMIVDSSGMTTASWGKKLPKSTHSKSHSCDQRRPALAAIERRCGGLRFCSIGLSYTMYTNY